MATDRERERKLEAERSKRARALPRIQRATTVEVTRLLKRAEKDIRSALAGAPSDYQAFVLPQLQASVRTALRTLGTGAGESLSRGAAHAFEAGIDTVERPLDAALGLDSQGDFRIAALLPQVDTSQLLAMRSFLTHKMADVSVTLANRVNAELGLAIIGTRSVGETTGRVAALLKTGRSRALTLIRTELGRAYSLAGQQRMEQAAEVLPGLKKQWRRSGKLRARLTHDAIDGQLRDADKPFSAAGASLLFPRDPAGPAAETVNCGCQSLPWMESWEVQHRGRKAFSEEEIARNPIRAEL